MTHVNVVQSSRRHSGTTAYHAGLAAEGSVARHYENTGHSICARRWRGESGEIDLIAQDGDVVVFIEVKQSRTHALAAEHLTGRQVQRIFACANEYLAQMPNGMSTNVRFDVALVDNTGKIEIIEPGFMS